MNYNELTNERKQELLKQELARYEGFKAMDLKLDMSRGKPSKEQLDLSMGIFDVLNSSSSLKGKQDYRNYGINDGIPEIKAIFTELLGITDDEIIVSGNASLVLMYDTIQRAMQFGVLGGEPWNKQGKIKPKYSNPMGIIYSDEVVRRFAALKPAAKDFRIMWDNAYMVHALYGQDKMFDIFAEAKKYGNEDIVYMFGSTSKISFAGAGIAFIAGSKRNMDSLRKLINIQSIGPDKVSQYAHALFFKNADGIYAQMEKHAEILRPKFDAVLEILDEELGDTGIAKWNKPRGGYFISCFLKKGTAKRTVQLAKEAGVTFTGAGATYPYKNDPDDSNLRIAPTLPPIDELRTAMKIFCCAAKIAALEK